MIRRWWLGALAICLLASALLARQGILSTTDGRVMQGDIQTSPDGKTINVTMYGSTLTLDRGSVASIDYPGDAAGDFQKGLGELDPNDVKGRLDLSRSELNARQYDLAAEAAKDAERLDPHNPEAAILLDTIQGERALDAKPAAASAAGAAVAPATQASSGKYLTMDDVYAIRRAELMPDDQVRVEFFNNVRKRYLGSGGDAGAFNAESETQQALDIIQSGDANLAKDVHVVSDPHVTADYRVLVQRRILAGCAAAGCHSGAGAGGLVLFPDARETLPSYTNFYILQQAGRKLTGGDTIGSGPVYRPMIDRLHAQSSLVLQFGLPRSMAGTPHPEAKGFRPTFASPEDPNFAAISRWIESMNPIVPDYGIKRIDN
ncbi:MAG: hypothetical protein ABSD28_11675 [Tepidisphaeraceae bacterium]